MTISRTHGAGPSDHKGARAGTHLVYTMHAAEKVP